MDEVSVDDVEGLVADVLIIIMSSSFERRDKIYFIYRYLININISKLYYKKVIQHIIQERDV